MNILFVNYGDFQSNSLNHIGPLANALARAGHACAVAVPSGLETLADVPDAHFQALEFGGLADFAFPNGEPADVIHAWTPREVVRRFVLACKRRFPDARLVIHLEDHEDHLTQTYSGREEDDFQLRRLDSFNPSVPPVLSHPLRSRGLLALADGVTLIVRTLEEMVPDFLPRRVIVPPVDLMQFSPDAGSAGEKDVLSLGEGVCVVAYTGNTTFANLADLRDLYSAIEMLRRRGRRMVLIKTGYQMDELAAHPLCSDAEAYRDLGFIEKGRLPALLAMSAVLIQPGRPGPFNDYRFPSKLPEFLASGRPVITPRANLGLELEDGANALLLSTGVPEEIAEKVERILDDAELAGRLGDGGRRFAERYFDASRSAADLVEIYLEARKRAPHPAWTEISDRPRATELSAWIAGAEADAARKDATDLFEESLDAVSADAARLLEDNTRQAHELRVFRHEMAEQIHVLNTGVHEANIRVHERNVELHERNIEMGALQQERDKALAERDQSRHEQSVLAKRLASMECSASWKITKPLRWIRGLIEGRGG